jgi:FkbM family methyltransferase
MASLMQKIQHRFSPFFDKFALLSIDAFAVQNKLVQVNKPVIFDIGAHTGKVAKIYRKRFPLASIHCFEPFTQSFQSLVKSVKDDPHTFCHQLALCDRQGKANLNANLSSATNSLLATDDRGAAFWGDGLLDTTAQLQVDTTTVDAFCLDRSIPHIDILKMDVQGAEFLVLMGAEAMLKEQKISLIYTELLMCPTYKEQRSLHEYLGFLDACGYKLLDFYNPVRRHHQLIQADVIFLSSSSKQIT